MYCPLCSPELVWKDPSKLPGLISFNALSEEMDSALNASPEMACVREILVVAGLEKSRETTGRNFSRLNKAPRKDGIMQLQEMTFFLLRR